MGNGFVSKHPMRRFSKTLDVWDTDSGYLASIEHASGMCSSDKSAENYKLLSGYSEKDVFVKHPHIKDQGSLVNEGYNGENISSLKECKMSCAKNKFCNFYSWAGFCFHSYSCHVTKEVPYRNSQRVVYQLRRTGTVVASALLEIKGNKILISETHVNVKWGKEDLKTEANNQIIAIHEELKNKLQPNLALIMGDFNHYSWNRSLQDTYFSNKYNDALHLYHDYPIEKGVYVPAFNTDRQQQNVFGQFDKGDDPCQLDYVFLHEDHHKYLTFAAVVGAFGQTYNEVVSDHLGVFTQYTLSRQNPRRV